MAHRRTSTSYFPAKESMCDKTPPALHSQGGIGTEALRHFYSKHFIPRMPADIQMTPSHRSIGSDFVVDEFNHSFTHSVQMDWMLPGVAPTGIHVSVTFVVVVKFEGGKLAAQRMYWDKATVLLQLGLLPDNLPVCGAEQAQKAADMTALPSNMLIE